MVGQGPFAGTGIDPPRGDAVAPGVALRGGEADDDGVSVRSMALRPTPGLVPCLFGSLGGVAYRGLVAGAVLRVGWIEAGQIGAGLDLLHDPVFQSFLLDGDGCHLR